MIGPFLRKQRSLLVPTFVSILLASLDFNRVQAILFPGSSTVLTDFDREVSA